MSLIVPAMLVFLALMACVMLVRAKTAPKESGGGLGSELCSALSLSLFLLSLLAWGSFLLSLPLDGGHPPLSFILLIVTLIASFCVSPAGVVVGVVGMLIWGRDDIAVRRIFRRNALCNTAIVAAGTVLYGVTRWTATLR